MVWNELLCDVDLVLVVTVPGRLARVYSGMAPNISFVAVLVVHANYKTTAPKDTPAMAMVDLSTRCLPNYSRKVASLSSVFIWLRM